MHSLNYQEYGHVVAAERVEAAKRVAKQPRLQHPPPVRSRVAYAAGRAANDHSGLWVVCAAAAVLAVWLGTLSLRAFVRR